MQECNKALAPLFTVMIYGSIFKVKYSRRVYISLIPLTLGVMLVCCNNISFNFLGILSALLSTIIFVLQTIFTKYLFNTHSIPNSSSTHKSMKLNKINILFYSSVISFTIMAPYILFFSNDFKILSSVPTQSNIIYLFTLNGLGHTTQALSAFMLLSAITAVSYSIASLLKRIIVVCVSILVFRDLDKIDATFGLGVVMCFGGLWAYDRAIAKSGGSSGGREDILVVSVRGDSPGNSNPNGKGKIILPL
jgi:solute carrier family 35, member E1